MIHLSTAVDEEVGAYIREYQLRVQTSNEKRWAKTSFTLKGSKENGLVVLKLQHLIVLLT